MTLAEIIATAGLCTSIFALGYAINEYYRINRRLRNTATYLPREIHIVVEYPKEPKL